MTGTCIDSRDLRYKVTIKRPSASKDTYGQSVEGVNPTTVIEPYAQILDARGGETLRGEQVDATASHLVKIRYTSTTINTTDWIQWGARRLNIVHVADPDNTRRVIYLHCKEQR